MSEMINVTCCHHCNEFNPVSFVRPMNFPDSRLYPRDLYFYRSSDSFRISDILGGRRSSDRRFCATMETAKPHSCTSWDDNIGFYPPRNVCCTIGGQPKYSETYDM